MAAQPTQDDNAGRLLDVQPGDVKMDRSEAGSNPAPPQESLRDKLRAHYQKGMKKRKARKLGNPLTPEVINRVAVPFYLFTVFASYKIGFVDVMPLMYEGYDLVILLQRCLITFVFLEMMVNWFGIRYVDSTYRRYLSVHGPPPHEKIQPSATENALLAVRQTQTSDSSSATLMPVMTDSLTTNVVNDGTPVERVRNGSTPTLSTKLTDNVDHSSTKIIPAGEMIRADSFSLKQEVDMANEEMDRRHDQINTRSIDDLLNPSYKSSSFPVLSRNDSKESPSSLFFTQDDSEKTGNGTANDTGIPERSAIEDTTTGNGAAMKSSSLTSPTPIVTTRGNVITQSYPYWSWVPCYDCGWARPPRCHHCPLCKTCVLKRDHHCFFAGNCVGYRNHRFFYVFLVWAWSGCMYATIHGFPYIGYFLWPEMSYIDAIFPIAIVRFLFGYTRFQAALSVTTLTFLVYFDVLAATFIYDHAWLISNSVTSFERMFLQRSLEIRDTRTLGQKIRSVFGPYWAASFFVPVHFFTEPQEDPVLWPDIQVFKR